MAIDISAKPVVLREASAEGLLLLQKGTVALINEGKIEKGNVPELVRAAAVHGVKQTPLMLFFCHPIPILSAKVLVDVGEDRIRVEVKVKTEGQTGCEMEALNGVATGLLMAWDLLKMYEKNRNGQYPNTSITGIRVLNKTKGKPYGSKAARRSFPI